MGNSCSMGIPLKQCCSSKTTLLNQKTNFDLNLPPESLIKIPKNNDHSDCDAKEEDIKTTKKKQKSIKYFDRYPTVKNNDTLQNNVNNNEMNLNEDMNNNNKHEPKKREKRNKCSSVTLKIQSSENNIIYVNSNQKKTFNLMKSYVDKVEKQKVTNINKVFYHNDSNYFDSDNYDLIMLKYINIIRQNPKIFIQEMKNIKENNINIINGIKYVYANNTSEKFFLDESFDNNFQELINFLEDHFNDKLNAIKYNDNLKVRLVSNEDTTCCSNISNLGPYSNIRKSENKLIIDLEDKEIGEMILRKRMEIKEKYPNCYFNINVVQDIKLSLLFLLLDNENEDEKILFREIVFNPETKGYAISCAKDKRRNFIAIISLA